MVSLALNIILKANKLKAASAAALAKALASEIVLDVSTITEQKTFQRAIGIIAIAKVIISPKCFLICTI